MGGKARSQSAKKPTGHERPSAERVAKILELLQEMWGEATCELDHENAFELLVATVLSAQTTDRRVNQVTPALFERYPDAAALAQARVADIEELIRPTGFYRMKAKHIIAMARVLVDRHGGEVPRTMGALVKLPGVKRKTANVVLGTAFGISSGVVVDTHVQRVSRRLGLTDKTSATDIERDLMELIPKERWIDVAQELIWHGRRICHARTPACERCALPGVCPSATVEPDQAVAPAVARAKARNVP